MWSVYFPVGDGIWSKGEWDEVGFRPVLFLVKKFTSYVIVFVLLVKHYLTLTFFNSYI